MISSLHPFLWLKKLMPQGLLGRAALIIILPVLLVQAITAYVFYDRHWTKTTDLLAESIAGAIGAAYELLPQQLAEEKETEKLQAWSERNFQLKLSSFPQSAPIVTPHFKTLSWRERYLAKQLSIFIKGPFSLTISSEVISVAIPYQGRVVLFETPTKRLFTRTTALLTWWALASPLFFLFIAFVFMRNQVRPLGLLAKRVEEFGKGRPVESLKPSGAREVQKVTQAFNAMRERISLQMKQRTEMLAGVSHDLRTFLTRISLEVEMLPPSDLTDSLKEDLHLMRYTLDDYLAFARGAEGEAVTLVDLKELIALSTKSHDQDRIKVTLPKEACFLTVRRQAMVRCLSNIVQNALKYAHHCQLKLTSHPRHFLITIDDDGPGIPAEHQENVFRPFFRLEKSRNPETGGVGLGLAIAKDITHSHGGTILLDRAPMGGTRVTIKLPA